MFSFLKRKKDDKQQVGQNPYSQPQPSRGPISSTQSYQPAQQSPAPTQSKPLIQASGYGAQYANDLSKNPPKPQPTPSPRPQQQQAPSLQQFMGQQLQQRGQMAGDRIADTERRANEQAGLQGQLFDVRNRTLGDIGNIQSEAFGQYGDQLRKGLDIQRGTSQRQIGDTQAMYDDNKYYNEQARRERQKGLEGTLAGLGTLESSAMMNIGAKIDQGAERMDRQDQRAMSSRIADIEDEYRQVENQTEGLIQQEAARYRQQVAALAGQMDQNSIEFQQAVSQIADVANQRINSILDNFDNFSYQAGMQMMQAQAQGDSSLQFDDNGQPLNQASLEWMMNNPDKHREAFGIASKEDEAAKRVAGTMASTVVNDIHRAYDVMDRYGRSAVGMLSGPIAALNSESQAAEMRGLIESIKSNIGFDQLLNIKKSGAGLGNVTEQQLASLQSVLGRLDAGMRPENLKYNLQRVEQIYSEIMRDAGMEIPMSVASTRPSLQDFLE